MIAFMLGLAVLVAIAFGLEALDFVTFKITGLVLIGTHLGLVLWEAASAYPVKMKVSPSTKNASHDALKARS